MIVLDTHALIWWVSGDSSQLSKAAVDVISTEQKNGEILISSISCWEIAMLIAKDRIAISMDVDAWLNLVKQIDSVRFVSVDNEIAVKSTELPGEFHKDPADRMIVATARKFAASLVTADEKILSYPHVKTIW
jgi:PIN domain nuclease of toxin-antitoxin system